MKLNKIILLTIALQLSSFVLASSLQEQLMSATANLKTAENNLASFLQNKNPGNINLLAQFLAPSLDKVIADKKANDNAASTEDSTELEEDIQDDSNENPGNINLLAQFLAPSLDKVIADKTANDNALITEDLTQLEQEIENDSNENSGNINNKNNLVPQFVAPSLDKVIADKTANDKAILAKNIVVTAPENKASANDLPTAQATARAQAVKDKFTDDTSIAGAQTAARALAVKDKYTSEQASANDLPAAQATARAQAVKDKFTDDTSIAGAQTAARALAVKDKYAADQASKNNLPTAQANARAQAIKDRFNSRRNNK